MKEDIERPKVENVGIAIAKQRAKDNQWEWNAYIFNLRDEKLENVLVTSRGYGQLSGEKKNTTTLRHFIEEVQPLDCEKIEPVMPGVFELSNEYWVSFYIEKVVYDKKFVFVNGSITEENMIDLPFLDCRGVLIR